MDVTMIKRYFDLSLLALVGLVLTVLIAQIDLVSETVNGYVSVILSMPLIVQSSVFLLLGVFKINFLIRLNVLNSKRLLFCNYKYPPVYFSVWMIAIPLLIYFPLQIDYFLQLPVVCFALGILLTITYIALLRYCTQKSSVKVKENTGVETEVKVKTSIEIENNLLNWLSKEEPVSDSNLLMFNRELYVERIYTRLKSNDVSNQIALCGEYGSGKTSILNIVCSRLETESWLTLRIDNWGRDSNTLGKQILNMMLTKASEKFDISALQPLPSNYQNALKAKGGLFNVFGKLTNNYEKAYYEQINELDLILDKLNVKMLVVVEDVDRNNDLVTHSSELGVLLDKLKSTKSIRFIVAVGYTEGVGNILSRVCDYREDLSNESFFDVINDLIKIWINRAKVESISLPKKYNEEFTFSSSVYLWGAGVSDQFHRIVNNLIRTPRICKQVCRRVDEVWKKNKLIGEIELVDLILIQAIRVAAPELFSLIKIYQQELIFGVSKQFSNDESHQKNIQKLKDIFQECFSKSSSSQVLSECMSILFPAWPDFDSNGHGFSGNCDQKISDRSRSVNYFDRCVREELIATEIPDQEIINLLKNYRDFVEHKDRSSIQDIVKRTINDRMFVERLIAFIPAFWAKTNNELYKGVINRFCLDIIRDVSGRYERGERFVNNLNNSNYMYDFNMEGILDFVKWLFQINNSNKRIDMINLIALKLLINNDMRLLVYVLKTQGGFNFFAIQDKLIEHLKFTLKANDANYLYHYDSYPTTLLNLCYQLSNKGNSSQLSTSYQLNDWFALIEILVDNALCKQGNSPHQVIVISKFFIRQTDDDRNQPLVNTDTLRQLDSALLSKLKTATLNHDRSELYNSYKNLLPIEVDTWCNAMNEIE
jgi:hypothetical protein